MKPEKYVCIQKCAELDLDRKKHCVETLDGYCHKHFAEYGCCPVGNIPVWKNVLVQK